MSVLNAEVSIDDTAHGELLQHLKRQGREQCAFQLVVADEARSLNHWCFNTDANAVRELERT